MQNLAQKVDELKILLKNARHARIVAHRNPDGDAVGSMLAFSYICDAFQLSYDVMVVDPIPEYLDFLPHMDKVTNYCELSEEEEIISNEKTDLVIFLDCGQINRAGVLADTILSHQKIVNIDHHISNTMFGHLNYVADITSTCELLFHIIQHLGLPLTKDLACLLYTGILTDTGHFQYDKTTAMTFAAVSALVEAGVKPYEIYNYIYQSYPTAWLSLLKNGLNKLELYDKDRVAIIAFSQNDFADGFDEITILAPIIASTDSIEVYALIKEKEDGTVSASLRSKSDDIDVAKIAEAFEGGGHQKAAGCRTSIHSLEEFKEMVKCEILKHL
ncbi:MAG: DHH family phosphoesterase [Brevinema sp.]